MVVMATDTKKRGQPTRYNPDMHVAWGASLARRGCSTAEIAADFGVSERTVYRWMNAHPEFCQAVSESKSRADEAVVTRLYDRAMGMEVVEEKEEVTVRDGVTTKKKTRTRRQLPPDTGAITFWLKNRQPSMWSDHPEASGQAATDEAIKAAIAKAGLR